MKQSTLLLLSLALLFGLTMQSLTATEGYFKHGYGVKYSAMGGAGSALSLSSIGAATNPASLSFLDSRFDISLSGFMPSREFTVSGAPSGFPGTFGLTPGTVESESNFFPVPTIGANYRLNETMAIGLMFIGNGGMNTDYPTAVFYDPTSEDTGVNLEQMFLGATYAIQFVENHSFGVTALLGYQRFSAKGLLSFAPYSSNAAKLSGNSVSTATGFGVRVGYQGKILSFLSAGVSYQTKISMSPFERYEGLFAEKGDFDVPATWNFGLAAKATKDLTIAVDVQKILYSGIKSIANPIIPNIQTAMLGNDNGAGFGWKDIAVFKIGAMYDVASDWTLMAGFAHNENPIAPSEVLFNILAPGVVESHFTFGVTKKLENGKEINFGFTYALSSSVEGPNPLEAPNQQTIKLTMSQIQFEIGYAFGL